MIIGGSCCSGQGKLRSFLSNGPRFHLYGRPQSRRDGEHVDVAVERDAALARARAAGDGDRPLAVVPALGLGGRGDGGDEGGGAVLVAVRVPGADAAGAAVDAVVGIARVQGRVGLVGAVGAGRDQGAVPVQAQGLVADGDEPGAVLAAFERLVPDPRVVLVAGQRQRVALHAAAEPPGHVLRHVAGPGYVRPLGGDALEVDAGQGHGGRGGDRVPLMHGRLDRAQGHGRAGADDHVERLGERRDLGQRRARLGRVPARGRAVVRARAGRGDGGVAAVVPSLSVQPAEARAITAAITTAASGANLGRGDVGARLIRPVWRTASVGGSVGGRVSVTRYSLAGVGRRWPAFPALAGVPGVGRRSGSFAAARSALLAVIWI